MNAPRELSALMSAHILMAKVGRKLQSPRSMRNPDFLGIQVGVHPSVKVSSLDLCDVEYIGSRWRIEPVSVV